MLGGRGAEPRAQAVARLRHMMSRREHGLGGENGIGWAGHGETL
jgi:hypothetical protein